MGIKSDVGATVEVDIEPRQQPVTVATVALPRGNNTRGVKDDRGAKLPPQSLVGRYEIVSELGEGGMGVVYKAFDPKLSRHIALKVHRSGTQTSGGQQRMIREAQALAQLSHPNVVAAYDVGTHDGAIFVAMEIADGLPLNRWLQENPSRSEIMKVLIGAGRGLAAAHKAGVLHRDFKPANVVVAADGMARVVDFGLARAMDATDADETEVPEEDVGPPAVESGSVLQQPLTHVGVIMGTPGYVAPEQLRGDPVDARADQFSFASTAYYSLTGSPRFSQKEMQSYRSSLESKDGQAIAEWPRSVPRRVRRIVDKGLEFQPTDRFESVAQMVDALASKKKTWLGLAVVVTLLGAFGIGAFARASQQTPICRLDRAPFATEWTPQRQATIRSAFLKTGVPGAEVSMNLMSERLSEYTIAWQSMKKEACQDTYVHGSQTEVLYQLRSACLDRQRANMGVLLGLLETADTQLVNLAPGIMMTFAPIDECADTAELLGERERLPKDDNIRGKIADNEAILDRGEAFWLALRGRDGEQAQRKFGVVLEQAEHTLRAAEELGYAGTIVRAHLQISLLLHSMDRMNEGVEHLFTAIPIAAENRLDREMGWLLFRLLEHWVELQQNVEATALLPAVNAHVLRYPSSPGLSAGVAYLNAILLNRDGNFAEAEGKITRAVALMKQAKDPWRESSALFALSDVYDEQRKYSESRNALQRAGDTLSRYFGKKHPRVLRLYLELIEVEVHTGHLDRAEEYLRRAIESDADQGSPVWAKDDLLFRRGYILENRKECGAALVQYAQALQVRRKNMGERSATLARLKSRIGICNLKLGKLDVAIQSLEQAVESYSHNKGVVSEAAEAAFALAQARLGRKGLRDKAVEAALVSRQLWKKGGGPFAGELELVEQWLADHAPSGAE